MGKDSNGKILKSIVWTVIWTLLLGSYGWATYTSRGIVTEVIANDRLRAAEDKDIRCQIDKTKDGFSAKLDEVKNQNMQILTKVTRLETLILKSR